MKSPNHVAIIMDGNGRWAKARKHNRLFGHVRGAKRAREAIEACSRSGVNFLTLYAFSTENWMRPQHEVTFLMKLLVKQLIKEQKTLMANDIKFECIGQIDRLPSVVRDVIEETIELTKNNAGMTLIFALSYGGRQEITAAVRDIAIKVKNGEIDPTEVDEAFIDGSLQTKHIPSPDLLIRTSGEYRLSNFLIWQMAYSEFYFSKKLWPDFRKEDLFEAFQTYNFRERRFGKISEQVQPIL